MCDLRLVEVKLEFGNVPGLDSEIEGKQTQPGNFDVRHQWIH